VFSTIAPPPARNSNAAPFLSAPPKRRPRKIDYGYLARYAAKLTSTDTRAIVQKPQ
jgi:hypothetical protein